MKKNRVYWIIGIIILFLLIGKGDFLGSIIEEKGYCGDGIIQPPEECDEGIDYDYYTCSDTCNRCDEC